MRRGCSGASVRITSRVVAQFKLGWSHEFASTDRPVTASFVGAPILPFTVYGAQPQRDGLVLGLLVSA